MMNTLDSIKMKVQVYSFSRSDGVFSLSFSVPFFRKFGFLFVNNASGYNFNGLMR